MPHFAVSTTIKGKLPRLPFLAMKNAALGAEYELSLLIAGDQLSRSLNKRYRKKDYPANILSFPYSKTNGELILNPRQALRDAPRFGFSFRAMLALLFIHGLLHLKGMKHGKKMEKMEETYLSRTKFLIK